MPGTLLGELQCSFACSLSVIIHVCPMVLEITLSTGCFLVPISHEAGASWHPSVAGHLSGRCSWVSWGKEGFMVPGNTTCPISELFRLSYVCRVITCEKRALLLPWNGRAWFSRTQVNQHDGLEARTRGMCRQLELAFIERYVQEVLKKISQQSWVTQPPLKQQITATIARFYREHVHQKIFIDPR